MAYRKDAETKATIGFELCHLREYVAKAGHLVRLVTRVVLTFVKSIGANSPVLNMLLSAYSQFRIEIDLDYINIFRSSGVLGVEVC
jgi:hypothetical protein